MSKLDPKRIIMEIALEAAVVRAVLDNGIIIDIVDECGQKLQDYKVRPGILMFKVFTNFCDERKSGPGRQFLLFLE